MIVHDKQKSGAQDMSLEVVWRDSLSHVRASLRSRQASNPYYRRAEQAIKIRARRAHWDANRCWVACATRSHLQEGNGQVGCDFATPLSSSRLAPTGM